MYKLSVCTHSVRHCAIYVSCCETICLSFLWFLFARAGPVMLWHDSNPAVLNSRKCHIKEVKCLVWFWSYAFVHITHDINFVFLFGANSMNACVCSIESGRRWCKYIAISPALKPMSIALIQSRMANRSISNRISSRKLYFFLLIDKQ